MCSLRVHIVKFDDGERYPILLRTDTGMPLFMPTIYITSMRRSANCAAKTLEADLRSIMQLYIWASIEDVDIEKRFDQGQFLGTSEIDAIVRAARMKCRELLKLNVFNGAVRQTTNTYSYEKVRKVTPQRSCPVKGATGAARIRRIRDYIDWLAGMSVNQISTKSSEFNILEQSRELMKKGFTARIPKNKRRNIEDAREGIDGATVNYILSVLNPESEDNPFADHGVRLRNQLIFLLLFTTGIRRGECLGIKIDDINFQDATLFVRRRADDPDDPRNDQPNAKTKDRKLPLESTLLDLIQAYVIDVRRVVPGANKHKFLFVTHRVGKTCGLPLSKSGYSKIFTTMSERVPDLPNGITGHALRHTWNNEFSKLMDERGTSEEREMQLRSYLMGWSYNSSMAVHYSRRHIKKKANEVSLDLQRKVTKGINIDVD